MSVERKLAAIMFTDIAGYTEQMSKDEAIAISLLNKKDSVLKPLIKEHNGTYVKSTGDGSLSYFNSAVDATMCAKRLQESIYDDKDLNVRVGVHLGDTIFEGGDIRGEGVNIASRLESMAVEGGVFISKEVQDQLINQKEFDGISLGLQSLKGVGRLIEVYGLKGEKLTEPNPDEYEDNKIDKHTDDEVPSIAIIPFENKGKDEDDFYAYGISADLISDISSAGLIRVSSLKRVEEVTDLSLDEKAIKLDVRYTVEGTLWKMDNMFQLSIELYDTKDKKVIWSDRWQEKWDNLPIIKGNLSEGLLKALNMMSNLNGKIDSLNTLAYSYYLKAKYILDNREDKNDITISRGLINKSLNLDSNLLLAHGLLAYSYDIEGNSDKALKIYKESLKKAIFLENISSEARFLQNISQILLYRDINYESEIFNNLDRALSIYKKVNDQLGIANIYTEIGIVNGTYGKDAEIIENYFKKSLEIYRQFDDKWYIGAALNNLGVHYQVTGKLKKALRYFKNSIEYKQKNENSDDLTGRYNTGVVYRELGDFNLAMSSFNEIYDISKKNGNIQNEVKALSQLMRINLTIGKYRDVVKLSREALKIYKKLDLKHDIANCHYMIGLVSNYNNQYKEAVKFLLKGLEFNKMYHDVSGDGENCQLFMNINLQLCIAYKNLNEKHSSQTIKKIIKNNTINSFVSYYYIYKVINDKSYIEVAYDMLQKNIKVIDGKFEKKFLSYPIPKAIVEEYNKVFKK